MRNEIISIQTLSKIVTALVPDSFKYIWSQCTVCHCNYWSKCSHVSFTAHALVCTATRHRIAWLDSASIVLASPYTSYLIPVVFVFAQRHQSASKSQVFCTYCTSHFAIIINCVLFFGESSYCGEFLETVMS